MYIVREQLKIGMRSVCVCALFAPANTSINRHVNSFLYLGFER